MVEVLGGAWHIAQKGSCVLRVFVYTLCSCAFQCLCLLFHRFTSSPSHMGMICNDVLVCASVCLSVYLSVCPCAYYVYFVHCAMCRTRLKRFVCRSNPALKLADEQNELFILKQTSNTTMAMLVWWEKYCKSQNVPGNGENKESGIQSRSEEKSTWRTRNVSTKPHTRDKFAWSLSLGSFSFENSPIFTEYIYCDELR